MSAAATGKLIKCSLGEGFWFLFLFPCFSWRAFEPLPFHLTSPSPCTETVSETDLRASNHCSVNAVLLLLWSCDVKSWSAFKLLFHPFPPPPLHGVTGSGESLRVTCAAWRSCAWLQTLALIYQSAPCRAVERAAAPGLRNLRFHQERRASTLLRYRTKCKLSHLGPLHWPCLPCGQPGGCVR